MSRELADLDRLEDLLGYRFRDRGLLEEALTHASTQDGHNERLEFLGDAVLNLVVAEMLYRADGEAREGVLTQRKALLVSRDTLERVGQRLEVGEFLRIGGSLEGRATVPRSLLGNALEAILGAIYLDSAAGAALGNAGDVALRWLEPERERLDREQARKHAKQELQAFAQRELGTLPSYEVVERYEHPETVAFKVVARLGERGFPPGWGASKKEAERWAAWEALLVLRREAAQQQQEGDGAGAPRAGAREDGDAG